MKRLCDLFIFQLKSFLINTQETVFICLWGQGCAATGSLSKEDAAFVCVEALECIPQSGFIFEVVNGENKVSDWKECLTRLMEKAE